MLSTSAPESAEVTKKTRTMKIARKDSKRAAGNCSKNRNRAVDSSACTAEPSSVRPWFMIRSMALLPNTVIHRKVKATGATSTPITNSLRVLPREILAMKSPTKGAQLIHQPQ